MADKYCLKLGIVTCVLALGLDQLSKWLLLSVIELPRMPPLAITPFLNLVMVWNKGISFGMLAEQDVPYALIALSTVIIILLSGWLWRTSSPFVAAALGMVIGGATGNIVDRLRFGAVADFFDFHIASYHWPAFNIADSAIFIGVVLLCVHSMFIEPKQKGKP